jgi:hypothetical protein
MRDAHLIYIDLDDLESAIRFYARHGRMSPGRQMGFARYVNEFVPSWSREACHRFVEAVTRDEGVAA